MCQKFASFNFQMLQYWSSYVLHNFSPLNKEAASSKKKKKKEIEKSYRKENLVCVKERDLQEPVANEQHAMVAAISSTGN